MCIFRRNLISHYTLSTNTEHIRYLSYFILLTDIVVCSEAHFMLLTLPWVFVIIARLFKGAEQNQHLIAIGSYRLTGGVVHTEPVQMK